MPGTSQDLRSRTFTRSYLAKPFRTWQDRQTRTFKRILPISPTRLEPPERILRELSWKHLHFMASSISLFKDFYGSLSDVNRISDFLWRTGNHAGVSQDWWSFKLCLLCLWFWLLKERGSEKMRAQSQAQATKQKSKKLQQRSWEPQTKKYQKHPETLAMRTLCFNDFPCTWTHHCWSYC